MTCLYTMRKLFLWFSLLACLWTCESDPATPPEEVIRMYQAYIDQNQFDQAAQLSTPAEQKRLQELEQMIAADVESTILETTFERIDCEIQSDTTRCTCLLEDQYEAYTAMFVLVKSNGNWLIDLPEDEAIEYDEELEAIIDSLLQDVN